MTHLVVAVTSHGFGHLAQVAPVVDELWRRNPTLRFTLLTEVPESFVRTWIKAPFAYLAHAGDFGLCMKSAFEVDRAATSARYRALHRDWPGQVERESRFLAALAPDCLLADVPYLSLAAAHRLGVPAIGLCSLNWADLFEHYLGAEPDADGCLAQMRAAYRGADLFIRPAPAMPMAWMENTASVGAIARIGCRRREALRAVLESGDTDRIVMAAPGGIETRLPIENWSTGSDVAWLVPDNWRITGQRVFPLSRLSMPFVDVLASVDCVLGKCGYGTVAECVVNGTPLMYIPRPDWPEEPHLIDWLQRHHAGVAVTPNTLEQGGLGEAIDRCRQLTVRRVRPKGIVEAADLLERYLRTRTAAGG